MKRAVAWSLAAVLAVFLLPPLLSAPGRTERGEEAPRETPASAEERFLTRGADAALRLTVRTEAGDVEMRMSDYLPLALAGEMPAAFAPEALRAQAVALRSYALYCRTHRKQAHPEADVCALPGCCAAFAEEADLRERWGERYEEYTEKLRAAVADTDGEYLTYADEPALAVFHAASLGFTESGADLGMSAPYLCSVPTPETAPEVRDLVTEVEVTAEELRETLSGAFPEAVFPGGPADWLGEATLNGAGRVARMELGGVSVSGLALRQLFSLRSTAFTLEYDGDRQCFVFRVSGYGHGLGMSQQGANRMAKDGADYREILAHYYPGTELFSVTA